MDKLGRLEVEQLKVTSTTPPADSGFYKIDETTMGVVGDLKFRHPKTGAMSSALTVTSDSAQGVVIEPSVRPCLVLLAAGQSNSKGAQAPDSTIDVVDPNIYQYGCNPGHAQYQTISGGSQLLQWPEDVANVNSPGQWVARDLARQTGCPVLIVPSSYGATAMIGSRWQPGNPGGDLFENAITKSNEAIAAAKIMFGSALFFGTYWVQGEADGDNNITQSVYEAGLTQLIAGFRSRITGAADSFFIVGQMPYETMQYYAGTQAIHYASRQIASMTPRSVFVPGPRGYTIAPGVNRHLTAQGARIHGLAMARAVAAALAKSAAGARITAPASSPAVSASDVYDTNLLLSWPPVPDADTYTVDQSVDNGATWTAVTRTWGDTPSQFVTGLTQSTPYKFRVRAICAGSVSGDAIVSVTTLSAAMLPALAAPGGITASAVLYNSMFISWSAVVGATDYKVEYSADTGATWTEVSRTPSTASTEAIAGLTDSTAYKIRVTTYGNGKYGAASTPIDVSTATPYSYNFDSDADGSTPAGMTVAVGALAVGTPAIPGWSKGMHVPADIASGTPAWFAKLTGPANSARQRATWRRGEISGGIDRGGILLRRQNGTATGGAYTGIEHGYWFVYYRANRQVQIYKCQAGGPAQLGSLVTVPTTDAIMFRATADGTALTFEYSIDGGATWAVAIAVTDSGFASGGFGFASMGISSANVWYDDIEIENI